jgi:hypothetical protein
LLAKDPVFLAMIIDDLQLGLIHPSGDGNQQESEWIQDSGISLHHYREPQCAETNQRNFKQIQFPDHTGRSRPAIAVLNTDLR